MSFSPNAREIVNELLEIEAWAEGLREKCHKARLLILKEEDVSTSSEGLAPLSDAQLADISARRYARIFKKSTRS